jgi:hypothetical protein
MAMKGSFLRGDQMSDAWYYVENDARAGPVSHEQLLKFLLSPRGGKTALVWRKGFSDWKPAGEVDELSNVFEGPPPIPQRIVQSPTVQVDVLPPPTNSVLTSPVKESGSKKALGIAASIFGALIGLFAVKAFGWTLIIWPVGLIGVTWLILARCNVNSAAVPMLAFVIGHTAWMIVGHMILYANGSLTDDQMWFLADLVIVIGLSIWFLSVRSRAAAIGILVYQICALGFGLMTMGEISIAGVSSQKMALAQALHIILRVVGIGLCIYAVAKLGKVRSSKHCVGG